MKVTSHLVLACDGGLPQQRVEVEVHGLADGGAQHGGARAREEAPHALQLHRLQPAPGTTSAMKKSESVYILLDPYNRSQLAETMLLPHK